VLPTTLSSTEDAITLAEVALGSDRLVALVDGPAKLVLPITGDVPPEGVERIDGILLLAIGDDPGNRLVLATRRGGPPAVTEDELACWRMMLARHEGRGLALFDWLVFVDGGGGVLSLADEAGPEPAWAA
jgi:hypothetical protein